MRAIDADAFKDYIRGACEDMKHLFKDNADFAKLITESFCKDIDEQPTIQPEPHWIPVEQALPEDDTVVLVCGKSGGIYTAIHNNSKTWIRGWWKMNSKNHHCNPTAWCNLPEPYKGVTT